MTDVMTSVFFDLHPSKANLASLRDGNCFLIAYTVSSYSLTQILLTVVEVGSTQSSSNALYDCPSSGFDKAFYAIGAEMNPNMR